MSEITILHNPRCSASRTALEIAAQAGIDVDVRLYLSDPLTEDELAALLAILEDRPADLVRRDATWTELGLVEADVDSPEKVARLLAATPALLQRPVLVRPGRAVIGRPKDRAAAFLADATQ